MKKNIISALFLTLGTLVFSQNYMSSDHVKVKELDQNGVLKFASFNANANISLAESSALLKETLGLDNNHKLIEVKNQTDIFGAQHQKFKQYFNDVEVAFSSYTVHSKNGIITSINGNFSPIEVSEHVNQLKSAEQIYQLGLANLGSDYSQIPEVFQGLTPTSKLVVLPQNMSNTNADRYAYLFPVISTTQGKVEKVYLDAMTGEVLRKDAIVHHHAVKNTVFTEEQTTYLEKIKQNHLVSKSFANFNFEPGNAETRYSGTRTIDTKETADGFLLEDDSRFVKTKNLDDDYLMVVLALMFGGPEDVEALTTDFIDDDNNWTAEEYHANKDDGALETHWSFSEIYDFFKEEYDRDGFDDENSPVVAFMHTSFFGDPRNAAWMSLSDLGEDYVGGFMFVGDGDYDPETETGAYDIFASLDVIAHEYSHGVTGAASGLVYERESGALNEGFADIWGATIEAKVAPEKQTWILGEDFVMIQPSGIRSLEEPKMFNQPNTYMGDFWQDASEDCIPGQDNDNCGVHTNSGVLNHWYYLAVEGGNGTNDNGFEYDFAGIGIQDVADLVYSVQLSYVQYQSKFADVRDFTIQEAEVMFGEDSEEAKTIAKAWCAVGVTTGEACEEEEEMGVFDIHSDSFAVYPNPAVDVLNVVADQLNPNIAYQVTNTAGQTVLRGKVDNQKINVSSLPKGVYILTLKGETTNKNIKFVKR